MITDTELVMQGLTQVLSLLLSFVVCDRPSSTVLKFFLPKLSPLSSLTKHPSAPLFFIIEAGLPIQISKRPSHPNLAILKRSPETVWPFINFEDTTTFNFLVVL